MNTEYPSDWSRAARVLVTWCDYGRLTFGVLALASLTDVLYRIGNGTLSVASVVLLCISGLLFLGHFAIYSDAEEFRRRNLHEHEDWELLLQDLGEALRPTKSERDAATGEGISGANMAAENSIRDKYADAVVTLLEDNRRIRRDLLQRAYLIVAAKFVSGYLFLLAHPGQTLIPDKVAELYVTLQDRMKDTITPFAAQELALTAFLRAFGLDEATLRQWQERQQPHAEQQASAPAAGSEEIRDESHAHSLRRRGTLR